MTHIPSINFATMERVLFKMEFRRIRQKGSHIFYKHDDGRTTTLPNHQGRDFARPLLHEILHDIKISPKEFLHILKDI